LRWGFLGSSSEPKMEDHPLSPIRDCLFNTRTFAATLHIMRPSPPSAIWERAMPLWKGAHFTWVFHSIWKYIYHNFLKVIILFHNQYK
jgi:hypothetical protein